MAKYLKLTKLKNIFSGSSTALTIDANSGLKYQNPGPHKRIDSP